jgi:cytochrome c biogenesis protein CcdA/thiol-disulfide isomerase/thioredoxin
MSLALLAYLGGVLTILSPCILPVVPFVFARADRPFVKTGLPILIGMAVTFGAIGTLAAVGGAWAVHANQWGRGAAMLVLAGVGVALVFPAAAERMTRPLVRLGAHLTHAAIPEGRPGNSVGVGASLVLGIATGLLWAPCAGPILGLILAGAALHGANVQTSFLLFAYAAGAATSLAVVLLLGGRVLTALRQSLGAGEWVRRSLGVIVLGSVAAIAFGLDTGALAKLSFAGTSRVEQAVLDRMRGTSAAVAPPRTDISLPVEGTLPSLSGAVTWLNSPPLSSQALRGKVLLIDFWTYSCINCLRTLPYLRGWATKYEPYGLVVIGVHTPEFAFEKDLANVRRAVHELRITYPVALDNNYAIWQGFNNQYWPAEYFIDADGRIRHHHFGEGDYEQSERIIQHLLIDAGYHNVPSEMSAARGMGAEAAPDFGQMQSPETYIGYEQAENFASGTVQRNIVHTYTPPARLDLNSWGLGGVWTVGKDKAVLQRAPGRIVFRFHARDLHLVLGPGPTGRPVRFLVTLDGRALGRAHGVDADERGTGMVTEERLYQLVRQSGPIVDHTFEIEFFDPGVQAFAFTFG